MTSRRQSKKDDRVIRLQALRGIEEIAIKCLGVAVTTVAMDEGSGYGERVRWDRAGEVAVDLAIQIRLHSESRMNSLLSTEDGRLELRRLAARAVEDLSKDAN